MRPNTSKDPDNVSAIGIQREHLFVRKKAGIYVVRILDISGIGQMHFVLMSDSVTKQICQ